MATQGTYDIKSCYGEENFLETSFFFGVRRVWGRKCPYGDWDQRVYSDTHVYSMIRWQSRKQQVSAYKTGIYTSCFRRPRLDCISVKFSVGFIIFLTMSSRTCWREASPQRIAIIAVIHSRDVVSWGSLKYRWFNICGEFSTATTPWSGADSWGVLMASLTSLHLVRTICSTQVYIWLMHL